MSPRISILGPQTHSPDAHKESQLLKEDTNSLENQTKQIEQSVFNGFELLSCYKDESSELHADIDVLMLQLIEKLEDMVGELRPEIIADYKMLKENIKCQKDDNEVLQKSLSDLKKENENQNLMVEACRKRVAQLENTVGMIENHPHYSQINEQEQSVYGYAQMKEDNPAVFQQYQAMSQ